MLARTLSSRGEEFWPPVYQENYLQIGAYIVKYQFAETTPEPNDLLRTDLTANPTITPLPVEAIARRLRKG